MKAQTHTTVDAEEVAKFSAMASEWWNPEGKFKPLHRINLLRVQWILDQLSVVSCRLSEKKPITDNRQLTTLEGLSLLDIGCGGGLVCEPMARLGAKVTGIDASEKNISVATLHAEQSGLNIEYICTTAESLVDSRQPMVKNTNDYGLSAKDYYDVVLALEIVEHVADVEAFVAASCALVKPGGIIIYSTLNRTLKSFALAIVGAEYVLRWLPRGTHEWEKFLRPSELCAHLRHNNIEVTEMTGMVMGPLDGKWRLGARDLGVNYLVAGRKLSS